MLLNNIVLRNFRNYADCEVCFSTPVNLIIGGNAQGKTSLLEAIYFLCTAESHRATSDGELIKHHETGFYLRGTLKNGSDDTLSLEAMKRIRGQFKLKKNGVLQTKRSEWIGQFNVVLFSPESLILVKGGPAERRRFLDLLISQTDSRYLRNLQEYRRILKQRNELLKHAFTDPVQLDAWDKLLVSYGTAVIIKRLATFEKLKAYAMENQRKLTGGQENIALTYQASGDITGNLSDASEIVEVRPETLTEIAKRFHEKLNISRDADLHRGTTLVGPHRDDFLIELENPAGSITAHAEWMENEEPEDETVDPEELEQELFRERARAYGSQGQQRTIALALKLAELELIRSVTGRDPIVLLDDVTSELDYNRTEYLLNALQNLSAQTFITATHVEPLVGYLNRPNVLTVENAQINSTLEANETS